MPKFLYKAKNPVGQIVTGSVEAADDRTLSTTLRDQGLFIIDIRARFSVTFINKLLSHFRDRISFSEITNFTRQVSVMISSGLTIIEALAVMRNQTENLGFQKLLDHLIISIEGGASFSSALGRHKDIFPNIYIAVVKSGELSGLLDKMLVRLADNLEKEREFRGKTKGALLYPLIILIGIAIVVIIMMIFVVPQMNILYEQLDIELPLPTRLVIGMSNLFLNFWYILLVLSVPLFFAFTAWKKTKPGRRAFDAFILRIPIWGKIERGINMTEFTRTLSFMIGAGTPIIDALNSVSNATKNALFGDALSRVSKKVEKGLSLAIAFSQEEIMPAIIPQMTRVGEETGKLDEVMLKVSAYFEDEVDRMVKNLSTVLEPVILAVLGVLVGFLMISVILPIYGLTQAL